MTLRTTRQTVSFAHPFRLSGLEEQPAGTYTVEIDEEIVDGVSFPVHRRVATLLLLPPTPAMNMAQIVTIDPRELEAALERDRAEAPYSAPEEAPSTNDPSSAKPNPGTKLARLLQRVMPGLRRI